MPGNKRGTKRKVDGDSRACRKSARFSTAPDRYGQSSKAELPEKLQYNRESFRTTRCSSLGRFEQIFETHDQLVSFLPPRSRNEKIVIRRHEEIERATAAVFETHYRAMKKIETLCQQIKWQTMWQHPALHSDKWYQNGNIFDLDREHITDLFEEYPVADTTDFRHYVAELVDRRLPDGDPFESREYCQKIMAVLDSFDSSGDPHAGFDQFRLTNTILAEATRWRPIGEEVEMTYMQCMDPKGVTVDDLIGDIKAYLLKAGGDYLDCATARRRLWRSYKSTISLEKTHSFCNCIPGNLLPVLEQLQLKAKEEIRKNTYLAVGTKLPVELADLVIDATLLVEEVPLDACIAEEVDVVYQPFEHWDKEILRRRKVLDQYSCSLIQYDRRDESRSSSSELCEHGIARRPK